MALHILPFISGNHAAPATMVSSDAATKGGRVSDGSGQLHPTETPELIAQKLIEMELEIERLQLLAPGSAQNHMEAGGWRGAHSRILHL